MNDDDAKLDLKKNDLKQRITNVASKQLTTSTQFKKPRVIRWRAIDEMDNGVVKKRLRTMFNVNLPVFRGMLDTLGASFDEPIEIDFFKKHPADHFKAKKTTAMWNMEKTSNNPDALWDMKSRFDKKSCIRYGRSVLKYFAESDPKYHSVLENVSVYNFHCQPKGGAIIEKHIFCGEEGIQKTKSDIDKGVDDGIYDKEQWNLLKARSSNDEYLKSLGADHEEKLGRFRSLGLDVEGNNYVGEKVYNLCEWFLNYKGKRYYVLFDPWTRTWLRCCLLKEVYSKNLFPYASWATHEDPENFWSIGYGDILYPIADAIVALFNQELTNREKQNYNARGYDKDMFPNVAALDKASYRPDALVEMDSKGGTRKLSEGLYTFTTPELQGTVELIDWVQQSTGKDTGITDVAQGAAVDATKKVNVAFLEQASVAKRIGYQSQSYTECWGQVGVRYVQGLKDHMTKPMYIEILGEEGIEPDVMTREDLYTKNDLGVKVISSTSQKADAESKKQSRIKGAQLLAQSQNVNSEWRDSIIMRDIMGMNESEIRMAFDTQNYAARDSVAKAHIVIQELLKKDSPNLNYAADVAFYKTISDYAIEHRNKLGKEIFLHFQSYLKSTETFMMANAKAKGAQRGMQTQRRNAMQQGQAKGGASNGRPQAQQQVAPEAVQG